jgi:uncharacterized membrane protein
MQNNELSNLLFRWIHVVAAILWIGQVFSLALIHRVSPRDPVDPAVAPFLIRSHLWAIWSSGAAFLSGLALLGIVYYGGGALTTPEQSFAVALAMGVAAVLGGFLIYDAIWKALRQQPVIATIVSIVMLTGTAAILSQFMTGRAMFAHIGGMLGAILASNTQQRIGPVERARLKAVTGKIPAQDLVEMAATRLRHNVALAPAVTVFMISNHFPTLYGAERSWLHVPAIVIVSWGLVKIWNLRRAR